MRNPLFTSKQTIRHLYETVYDYIEFHLYIYQKLLLRQHYHALSFIWMIFRIHKDRMKPFNVIWINSRSIIPKLNSIFNLHTHLIRFRIQIDLKDWSENAYILDQLIKYSI